MFLNKILIYFLYYHIVLINFNMKLRQDILSSIKSLRIFHAQMYLYFGCKKVNVTFVFKKSLNYIIIYMKTMCIDFAKILMYDRIFKIRNQVSLTRKRFPSAGYIVCSKIHMYSFWNFFFLFLIDLCFQWKHTCTRCAAMRIFYNSTTFVQTFHTYIESQMKKKKITRISKVHRPIFLLGVIITQINFVYPVISCTKRKKGNTGSQSFSKLFKSFATPKQKPKLKEEKVNWKQKCKKRKWKSFFVFKYISLENQILFSDIAVWGIQFKHCKKCGVENI